MSDRKIEIEDLRRFKFVSDPQVSPEGDKIAFVLSTINYEQDAYERHIWMLDIASNEVKPFTYGSGKDTFPRWSPDGRQLLFMSRGRQPKKKTQLWLISVSGGEARLIANTDEGIMRPIWATDSKRILFLSRVWMREKPKSDVKVIKRLKYKRNGLGTFEGRRSHLFATNIDGKYKQITNGEFDAESAKYSPDGESIAFTTNMDKDADISRIRDIFIIPANGGEHKKLTHGSHVISDLSWSPSGKEIAFLGHNQNRGVATNTDIWIMPSEGGDPINITSSFDRSLGRGVGSDVRVATPNPGAVWHPNSGSIYFVTGIVPTANIYRVDRNIAEIEQITTSKNIEGFSFSADGSVLAYSAMDANHLAEIWTMTEDGERQVTRFNNELFEELKLSVPEQYVFKNELGAEIDGWIIKPYGFQKGKKYPAVLEIHGGPRAIYGNAMYQEFQVLAAKGYIVLYTNPRGSGGYGEDHAANLLGLSGYVDYRDLMTFIDDALERFDFIDPERLGVTGGSYGGFMTYWIITHNNRFRAAISCRAASNRYSQHGTSDNQFRGIGREDGAWAYPWRDEENLMKMSPIRYAADAKTPTLIIHSEKDLRCPIGQAEQFFVALKELEVDTELVRFPDETHELSRSGKPKHREERLQHILRWFNKYLQ